MSKNRKPINLSYQECMTLAEKWNRAGRAECDIEETDLEKLGMSMADLELRSWFDFCEQVYRHVTGRAHPGSTKRGTGSRSREYGDRVADAIRELAPPLGGTTSAAARGAQSPESAP